MIKPDNKLVFKNTESQFKEQLKSFAKQSFLRGHLIVTKEGTLDRTNFLVFLWEKIRGIVGLCDWTNNCLVEFKVIELLSAGKKYVRSQEEVELVKAVARRVGLTEKTGKAHFELQQLVDKIQKNISQTTPEEELEKLAGKFAEHHVEELAPFFSNNARITQTFKDSHSAQDGDYSEKKQSGDVGDESSSNSSGNEESPENGTSQEGQESKVDLSEALKINSGGKELTLSIEVLAKVPDLQPHLPNHNSKVLNSADLSKTEVKLGSPKTGLLKSEKTQMGPWRITATVGLAVATAATLLAWQYFLPQSPPVPASTSSPKIDLLVFRPETQPILPNAAFQSNTTFQPIKMVQEPLGEIVQEPPTTSEENVVFQIDSLVFGPETPPILSNTPSQPVKIEFDQLNQQEEEETHRSKSISEQAFFIYQKATSILGFIGIGALGAGIFIASKFKGSFQSTKKVDLPIVQEERGKADQNPDKPSESLSQEQDPSLEGDEPPNTGVETGVESYPQGVLQLAIRTDGAEAKRESIGEGQNEEADQNPDKLSKPLSQEQDPSLEGGEPPSTGVENYPQGGLQLARATAVSKEEDMGEVGLEEVGVEEVSEVVFPPSTLQIAAMEPPELSTASKLLSWLKSNGMKVTDTLLAHILGGSFAEAADLEGDEAKSPLGFLIWCLEECPDFLGADIWGAQANLLKKALVIEETIFLALKSTTRDISDQRAEFEKPGKGYKFADLEKLDRKLVDEIDQTVNLLGKTIKEALIEDKEVLFPAGWTNTPAGHALYYKISLQTNGKYTFEVFNRGAGNRYHGSVPYRLKSLYPGSMRLIDVDLDKILSSPFLTGIVEQRCFAKNPFLGGEGKKTSYDECDVYESLFSFLGGQVQTVDAELEDLLTPQTGGVCTWKSLSAVLRSSFGYLPFKKLKLRLEIQVLWSHYEQNKDQLNTNVEKRHLLSRALASASRNMQTMKGEMAADEYTQVIALFATIEADLKKAYQLHIQTKGEEANRLAPSLYQAQLPEAPVKPIPIKAFGVPQPDEKEYEKYRENLAVYQNSLCQTTASSLLTQTISEVIGSPKLEGSIDLASAKKLASALDQWNPRPETLLTDLKNFNSLCEATSQKGQHSAVNDSFLKIMRLLPVPTSDLSTSGGIFWQNVVKANKDQVKDLIEVVAQLSHHHYTSCFYIEGSAACPPSRTHALVKSLHIQNTLNSQSFFAGMNLEMPAEPVEFHYLEQIFSAGKYREIAFRSMDPLIDEELACIYKDLQRVAALYAEKDKSERKRFAFEWNTKKQKTPYGNQFNEEMALESSTRQENLNPEFAFIARLLKDSDFYKKASAHYMEMKNPCSKSFKELLFSEQIAFVYCSGGDKLLPPPFLSWRKQVIESRLLLYGPFGPPLSYTIENSKELDCKIQYQVLTQRGKEKIVILYDKPSALSRFASDYPEIVNNAEKPCSRYRPNMRPLNAEIQKKKVKIWEDKPTLTENGVFSERFSAYEMPMTKEIRQQLCLGTNKELQIEETLAYFARNSRLLDDPDYQTLFYTLIFEEDFLLKELKQNTNSLETFKQFFEQGYQLARDFGNVSTAVFYLNFARHLNRYTTFLNRESHSLPVKEKLLSLLDLGSFNPGEKSLIYEELLAFYVSVESINRDDLILMARALVFLSTNPVPPELQQPHKVQEQVDAINKFCFNFQKAMSSDPTAFINEVLTPIISDYNPLSWNGDSFPIFKTSDGSTLNILTGDFFKKGLPTASLPDKILTHPTYKSLFNKNYGAKKINSNAYEFVDQVGDTYRIQYHVLPSGAKQLYVQRKIDKTWYEWRHPSQLKGLFNGAIASNHTHWVACDRSLRVELYDFDGVPKAHAKLDATGCLIHLKSYANNAVGEELEWVNHALIEKSNFSFLTSFEHPFYINIWKDKNETPCLIQLPRYDLEFRLDQKKLNQPKWECLSFPGYQLAANQYVANLEPVEGYLVLENNQGEKLIIFPVQVIDARKSSKNPVFSEKIVYDRDLEKSVQRYACYRLKPVGITGLTVVEATASKETSSMEANLYLAYRKLALGKYEEARNLLSISKLPLIGNFVKELNLLQKIMTLGEITNDTTPQGAALRMHAAYLHIELTERSGVEQASDESNKEVWESLRQDCDRYIALISQLGSLLLDPSEAQLIMRTVMAKLMSDEKKIFGLEAIKAYLKEAGFAFKKAKDFSSGVQKTAALIESEDLKENKEASVLFDAVKDALFTDPDHWGKNDKFCGNFFESYHDNNSTLEDLKKAPFLRTRLGEDGIKYLLTRWIKTPENERSAFSGEIQACLALSAYDQSSFKLLARAVLVMISRYPTRYVIKPPPEQDLNCMTWSDRKKSWLNDNIRPILKDYDKEMRGSNELNRTFRSQSVRVKNTEKRSLRKTTLPEHTLGYVGIYPPIRKTKQNDLLASMRSEDRFTPDKFLKPIEENETAAIKQGKVQALDDTLKKATPLFSKKIESNRCVANETHRLQNDCEEFVRQSKAALEAASYMTVDPNDLPALQQKLTSEIETLNISLNEQEAFLVRFVNPLPEVSNQAQADTKAKFLSGQHEEIGIEKLMILYGRKQLNQLIGVSSIVTKDNVGELNTNVAEYLKLATRSQQLQRTLEKTKACLEQTQSAEILGQETKQSLIEELSNKRQFDSSEHPENLVFEYYGNMLLRKDQVDNLKLFFKDSKIEPVLQMIMGSGKTSVLMPLMALFLANGENLAILMIPDELLDSVFEEMRVKLGDGFMQMIYPFNYGRNSDYSIEGLETLKAKLLNIKHAKGCLIASPKSFHCFYLKFREIWCAMDKSEGKERAELAEQFILMRNILSILKKNGHVLIDEIDLTLHCRNEVNFPIGAPSFIKERDMDVLFELYDVLLESEALKPHFKAEFDRNKELSKAPSFNSETYHKTIKRLLAAEFLNKMKEKNKSEKNPIGSKELTERLQNCLKTADTTLLLDFLCQDEKGFDKAYTYVQTISDKDILNILHLAREELNNKFPITLQKNCDEDYGLRGQIFATPLDKGRSILSLENGKLIESTRFADPFECASYTLQAYYNHDIPTALIEKQVAILQQRAIDDMQKEKSLENCQAYEEFSNLCGKKNLKGIHMLKLSPENYQQITDNVNQDPTLRKLFLKRYVLSTISFQTTKLNSNAQSLIALFSKVYGFSGTTWNSATYHDRLSTIPSIGTDARTIFALLGRAGSPHKVDSVDFGNPLAFIKKLPCEKRELALIDNGAYLKGESILIEANMLLTQLNGKDSSIKGVVFFDDQNKKVILEIGKQDPIALTESNLKSKERFTIYTKPFTTGADVPQDPHAIAYFTVGRNLILRDYLQSVFRMRKIDQTQEIRILISIEVKKVMNTFFKRDEDSPISHEDLIVFSAYNQANQIGEDNYVAIKQKMHQIIQEEVFKILLDETLNPDNAAKLYTKEVEKVFVDSSAEEPYELYGSKEHREEAAVILEKDAIKSKGLLDTILSSSSLLRERVNKEEVKQAIDQKVNINIVPETLAWNEQDKSDRLMQVQAKAEVQVKTLLQVQRHVAERNPATWQYFPWPEGNIYNHSFYLNPPASKEGSPSLTYSISSFLLRQPSLASLASLFKDEALKVSFNFAPQPIYKQTDREAIPFDAYQKIIERVLISFSKSTGKWEVTVMDQEEAADFRKRLRECKKIANDSDLKLCLHNLHLGVIEKGEDSPSPSELQSKELLILLTKLKFLNGQLSYTESEIEILKNWISKPKWLKIKDVYQSVVIAYQPDPDHIIQTFDHLFAA